MESPRNAELLGDVTNFLHRVYSSIAETLPDVRDETQGDEADGGIIELKSDPYQSAAKGHAAKPRKMHRSVAIRDTALELRYLPPGTMKEYWVQYCRQSTLTAPASFPCFWRVALIKQSVAGLFFFRVLRFEPS